MEIVALQMELASFIMAEVLTRAGSFSIAQAQKYKNQYGPEQLDRLISFFNFMDRDLV